MTDHAELLTEDRMIPADTAGIELRLRRKRRHDLRHFGADRTVLLMHGATFPGASLFDVPLEGGSFMDALARRGYDVYAVDARGYGGSTRPPEMSALPGAAPPLTRTGEAVRDLDAAVRHILARNGLAQLNLVAMSWGGSVAGAFTSTHNALVRRLALIAPLWLATGPVRIDAGGTIGAYRQIDVRAFRARWLEPVPEQHRAALIPPGGFEAWADTTLATDPASGLPGTIRAPAGAVADVREFWCTGSPLYDPAAIRVPVLITQAEWDADVTPDRVQNLFSRLTGTPYRRFTLIGEGTHMVVLERNRWQVLDAVTSFLEEEPPAPTA